MKKLFLVLAVLASMQMANAQQGKSVSAAKSAVEAAKLAVDNPKKATKTATWMKYGQSLVAAYSAPQGNGWIGADKTQLQLVMGKDKPKSVETVELGGQQMTKEVYATSNYYFNANGILQMIEITKPIYDDALDQALAAFAKAAELDVKGQKTKDLLAAIQDIATKYTDEAYNAYTFGDFAKSSACFEAAAKASATAPLSKLDTNAVYNTAFTAWLGADMDRAKSFFGKCIEYQYYGEGGEVYAKLADIAEKAGDKEGSKGYLEEAFTKFPQSQSILVGLINYYVTSGENTDRLFELLNEAKKNEPNNASLYYVEGNIHDKLGQIDEAVASYRQCAQIDPKYAFGYIGEGILFYNQAVKLQEEAQNELDDNKYMAMLEKFEQALKACIEPFEKALELTSDDQTRVSIAEYLKNACFRFRTSDDAYMQKYEMYSKMVAEGRN